MSSLPSLVEELRSHFEDSLSDIADRTKPSEKRCIILSGGVDTCAILAAAKKVGVTFEAAFTVVTGDDSPDKDFAIAAAKEYNIQNHYVLPITSDELISKFLPHCVKLLQIFDGMTIRNSLVVLAALCKASEMGFEHAVVGDGSDELFGGYSFMWGCEDDLEQWKDKRDKMCAKWTFATEELANSYGLKTYSPYMEPKFVEWAITNTNRTHCIGTRPIKLVYGGEAVDHITGKVILREAYETVASWRRKDPIEVGSGITQIGHDEYWSDIISDEEYDKEVSILREQGYIIKGKEYLVNFRVFQEYFGKKNEDTGITIIEQLPSGKKRLPIGEGCAGCCFEIGDNNFCHICGAFPAQR